ncbi:probable deoxycytidylate deaminase [Ceratitis capitata]|uniref:probable deoxycytidylate deaminase n=1 Tax=Ceratitis capitata TaxID=7213 RepID=UPI000329B239|nr:probable deoxycytidylate deaminase [Ceratitis capitata]XP_012155631.1 probable deoxycytidylate deaminase [Ceratitis capitata]
MTEHDCDVSVSPKSTTPNGTTISNSTSSSRSVSSSSSSNSSDNCNRTTHDSSDNSSCCRSRSPSPTFIADHDMDKNIVTLLADDKFHNEILNLAMKHNNNLDQHVQNCVIDDRNRITSVGTTDLLEDHEFLMGIALLASQRSEDPKTKVGACLVDRKNRIVGIGYNHFPPNYSDEPYPWCKEKENQLNNKLTYVIHAESDAIFTSQPADLRGATIYSTLMPCNECAKQIIQAGISKVYYLNSKEFEKWIYKASRRMLLAARVALQKLE